MRFKIEKIQQTYVTSSTERDILIEKLKLQVQELQQGSVDISRFKEEAFNTNEQLRQAQEDFYQHLNLVQVQQNVLDGYAQSVSEKLSEHSNVQNNFKKVILWQSRHKLTPTYLARVTEGDKLKFKIASDSWENNLHESQHLTDNAQKDCNIFINGAMDLVIDLDMPSAQSMGEAIKRDSCIADVHKQRKDTKDMINKLDKIKIECINQFLVHPQSSTKFIKKASSKLQAELLNTEGKVFNCEINVETDPPALITKIMNIYKQWKDYMEKVERIQSQS